MIAHEVVHALQDEHFKLTRGPFAPRPRDHDGELAAQALVEGDATEVQTRYVASLSALDLIGELGADARRACHRGVAAGGVPFLQRQLEFPYTAGQEFVRALRARGGQRLLDRAFRHPPRTTAAVLDPARYLAGDPPPRRVVRLPARELPLRDVVRRRGPGRADREARARARLAGRAPGGRRQGLDLRLATRAAAAAAAALKRAPARVGGRSRSTAGSCACGSRATKASVRRAFLPIGTPWSHPQGAVRQRVLPNGDCTQSSTRLACTCTAARRIPTIASSRRSR